MENLSPIKGCSKPRTSKHIAAATVKPRVAAESGTNQGSRLRRPSSEQFTSFAADVEALRGAREIAAVTAQVTANAAAVIEHRQNVDDRQFRIAESVASGKIFPSRAQKRRRQRLAAAAKSANHFPTRKASRQKPAVYGARRRAKHRLRRTPQQAASIYFHFNGDDPQPDLYPSEPELCSNIPVAYPTRIDYEGYDCPTRFEGNIHSLYGPAFVSPVVCVPAPSNLCYSCLCYGDYLARARAWIQARNEHLRLGLHLPFEPSCHPVFAPGGANWGAPFQWNPGQLSNWRVSSSNR